MAKAFFFFTYVMALAAVCAEGSMELELYTALNNNADCRIVASYYQNREYQRNVAMWIVAGVMAVIYCIMYIIRRCCCVRKNSGPVNVQKSTPTSDASKV